MHSFYRLVTVLVFVITLISCSEKTEPNFIIEGSISPLKGGTITLLREIDIERKISEEIDVINLSKEGEFKEGYTSEPGLYRLRINNKKSLLLAINNGQHIEIKITDIDSKNLNTSISGSKDSEVLLAYENFRKKSLDSLVQSVRRQVRKVKKGANPDQDKIIKLQQLEIENYAIHLKELNEFVKNNMNNTLGLYATSIRWKGAENLNLYDSLTMAFEITHPDLEITKKLREKVSRLQQTSIDGIAPDIEMKTPEGKNIRLSSVQKKYTLIDFWASWCGPCRSESNTLNDLYGKYNAKGFEIYGVSLDDKKNKWLKAIEKDNRTWPNVSSLQGFKTPASYDYAVTALPDNYLIDANRKIIAKNIHGEELVTLINELLDK
jgi:thiol-disulfide isomerase/thioredoxin